MSTRDDHSDGADGRTALLAAVEDLLAVTDVLLNNTTRAHLKAARDRVIADRFNLVVVGEFKRGKSTLINALLGRELLPTAVVPLTSVVTVIRFGRRDRMVVRFADGRECESPVAALADFVTEAGNPENEKAVELTSLEVDDPLLEDGLELIDTPGVGSIHAHNTAVTCGFLPRTDAALCVLDAGQPLSESERDLLLALAESVPRIVVVVNKIDALVGADSSVALGFIRSAVSKLFDDRRVEVVAASAREGDGITALRERLRHLALEEREQLLLQSVGRSAAAAARAGVEAARFEAHAIELPLEELRRRAELFSARAEELREASADAADLLERAVKRALDRLLDEPLQGYAPAEGHGCERRCARTLRTSVRSRRATLLTSSTDGSMTTCAVSSHSWYRGLRRPSPVSWPSSSAAMPTELSRSSPMFKASPRTCSARVPASCCPRPG